MNAAPAELIKLNDMAAAGDWLGVQAFARGMLAAQACGLERRYAAAVGRIENWFSAEFRGLAPWPPELSDDFVIENRRALALFVHQFGSIKPILDDIRAVAASRARVNSLRYCLVSDRGRRPCRLESLLAQFRADPNAVGKLKSPAAKFNVDEVPSL